MLSMKKKTTESFNQEKQLFKGIELQLKPYTFVIYFYVKLHTFYSRAYNNFVTLFERH